MWKKVRSRYYIKELSKNKTKENFKEWFLALEEKKCLAISLWLLSKKSYLKKQWEQKMRDKLFSEELIEKIYRKKLSFYFNEKEELKRQIAGYILQGKGKLWVQKKLSPNISIDPSLFNDMLKDFFTEEEVEQKICHILHARKIYQEKGRDKTIAFFLRRGFSYQEIQQALSKFLLTCS